jgi:sec-independent protein translocase protein TatC
VAFALRRRGPSKFARASDGSMTLIEHVRELRNRLFWASLGLLGGLIVGWFLAEPVYNILRQPYCRLEGSTDASGVCQQFIMLGPADGLVLKLKLALWIGLLVGAPVWLYQLWAFVAPGLHRHERKWAYVFVAISVPLFAAGATLAYLVVDRGLEFLIEAGVGDLSAGLEMSRYIAFITNMILLFGLGFEFPLLLLMLNFTGVVTARRLLSWWRVIVFLSFAFAAIATPDPGPFGMTLLALSLSLLYFVAVGVAFISDRHKGRGKEIYSGLDDDEVSPLTLDPEPVTAGEQIDTVEPIAAPDPVTTSQPIDRRYDDMT